MNAIGLTILGIILFLVLTGPPSRALFGMMAGVLYLTQAQQIDVGGFNLYAFRVIELAGFLRVMFRREFSFSQLTRIDKALLAFVIYTVLVYALRTTDDIAYRIGWGVDAFICYFTFRALLSATPDLRWCLSAFLILLLPYAVLVLYESYSRNNIFIPIGGRTATADMIREGRLRAAGSFRHASLLGSLGATFLPLYIGLAFNKAFRIKAIIGIGSCLAIVWASNSGGPLSCALVAICGWSFWKLRTRMQWVRRWMLGMFLALAVVMKAPIWYLIAKASSVTGGDGYHRSRLMEQAFNHLSSWWINGMPIESTQTWFPYYIRATGGADITNQFLSYGLAAGLGSMALFILLLIRALRAVGEAQVVARETRAPSAPDEYILWGLGVMLVVHLFNWVGINYFDQFFAIWYAQLAAIAVFTQRTRELRDDEEPNRP